MIKLLSLFESVICLLSGTTYPTIGLIYPNLCNLRGILETEFQMKTDIAENCRKAILEDLQLRWEFSQQLCLKRLFLDLQFKA